MAPITEQQYVEMKQRTDRARGFKTYKVDRDFEVECVKVCDDDGKPVYKKKRIRQSSKPLLNKLESEFLEKIRTDDPKSVIYQQAMRFRLGNGIWYKPDFLVFRNIPGLRPWAVEVKGPKSWRGGFENLKVAAGLYKDFRWVLTWKENGEWKDQEVLA